MMSRKSVTCWANALRPRRVRLLGMRLARDEFLNHGHVAGFSRVARWAPRLPSVDATSF